MGFGKRVSGLDTLRFIAASWVALSHGAAFPMKGIFHFSGPLAHIFIGAYDCAFDGVAAVIVFFVISGFCIHYPWFKAGAIDIPAHFIRRYIRIGAPLLAVLVIMSLLPSNIAGGEKAVLWSIYCELIYYSLYPVLFVLFRTFGIWSIIAVSIFAAAIPVTLHPTFLYPWQFGVSLTWIVFIPAWLLGCALAERLVRQQRRPVKSSVVSWRLGILAYSSAATMLVYHSPLEKIGYPLTMMPFALLSFFWLEQELWNFSEKPPYSSFEWLGTWSYSIYLVHNMVIRAVTDLSLNSIIAWLIMMPGIFILSYAFAYFVEFPSHKAARKLASIVAVKKRTA